MSKRRSGFTLIELLVVIAIIAILAAILFPVFAQARAKARQATCLSNVKQIGVGIMAYTQDYDEMFPMANYPLAGTTNNTSWHFLVDPYVKAGYPQNVANSNNQKISIYVCPEFTKATPAGSVQPGNRPSSSYSANDFVMGSMDTNRAAANRRMPQSVAVVQAPAQVVLFGPHTGQCVWTEGNDTANGDATVPVNCNKGYMSARFRHNDGANYAFCDGHAKWYKAPAAWNQEARSGVCWRSPSVNNIYANCAAWFSER